MTSDPRPPKSAPVASFLSFLWPGLGQAWQGRRRAALLWAVPPLALVALAVGAALNGPAALAGSLLTPSMAFVAFVLILALGLWRSAAIIEAAVRGGRRLTASSIVVVAVLVTIVIATHGMPAYYAWSVHQAGSRIFVADLPDLSNPTPSPDPSAAEPADNADDFVATPEATPASADDRINILVTGIDSGVGITHSLTDTLMVVSVDPKTGDVAMVSFPRDLSDFPLSDGRTFSGKINSLMTYARRHPGEFPDGALPTLIKELGFLLGTPIHYYAAVNMTGFVKAVNLVGGLTVNNPRAINDPHYGWADGRPQGFRLPAGRQNLDGLEALAYVRSRYGAGDNDFSRARRQQELILALQRKMIRPENIARIPELLDTLGDSIRTNFPEGRVGEMIDLAQRVSGDNVKQYVLGPPYSFHPPTSETGGIYKLRLRQDRLEKLSINLFGEDSRYYKQNQ